MLKKSKPKITKLRADRGTARASITAGDVKLALALPLYLILAWCLPERLWPAACRWLTGAGQRPNRLVAKVTAAQPGELTSWRPRAIVTALETGRLEHYFQILRDYRPGGWRPKFEIEGLEHLEQALAGGKGAILWVDHFVFNGLAPKLALALAGHPYRHVSRPEHGFSKTAFGIRFLNPIRVIVENRYLAGRVLIERGRETRVIRDIRKCLADNQAVSITAGAWEGKNIAQVPIIGGTLPLAVGAPGLAETTGAPLIPLVVVRDRNSGRYRIVLEAPLTTGTDVPRNQAVDQLLAAYASRLTPWIMKYPDQWRGWSYLKPGADDLEGNTDGS